MNRRKDSGKTSIVLSGGLLCCILWVILIILKSAEVINMEWSAVLLGFLWIPALWLLMGIVIGGMLVLAAHIKHRIREWKVKRRIKRQAMAAGVWDKPQALGGRALDIYAWEVCRLKRKPEEADKDLRRRCMAAGIASTKGTAKREGHQNG